MLNLTNIWAKLDFKIRVETSLRQAQPVNLALSRCLQEEKQADRQKMGMTDEPERATISWVVKPWFEKDVMSPLRFKLGVGMLLLAALKLAVVESLLPNTTVQFGPPSWKKKKKKEEMSKYRNNPSSRSMVLLDLGSRCTPPTQKRQ